MPWDVVVVGAGAAGLMSAIVAAERGRKTLVLEKNRKPGVKILISGGTRCNVTHAIDRRGIIDAFGPQGRFLHSALAALDPDGVVRWLADEGVPTKVEPTGKIFPVSNRAVDVLSAFLRRLDRSGARLALENPLHSIERIEDGFRLATKKETIETCTLILAVGGKSYPGCGTTGDGYAWSAGLGHSIVPPRPALVPLKVADGWVTELTGITLADVELELTRPSEADSRRAKPTRRRGGFLFTHFGLSGPSVLDISRFVTLEPDPSMLRLSCDFAPPISAEHLDDQLRWAAATEGRRHLANVLATVIPHRLAEVLIERAGLPRDRRLAELPKGDRARLVEAIKRQPVTPIGTMGFPKAEVTAGGVALEEVDSRTMQSKIVPGLFIVGELLDLDGPIGGYNFQSAFSTGTLAGLNV